VLILGMAYRPGTYIVEESAGLHVAKVLKDGGCRVLVHDCSATSQNSPSLLQFEVLSQLNKIKNEKNLKAILICCPWPEYKNLALPKSAKIFDPWGVRT
jgi:UDPglucose 6-dehydrogenase